MALQKVGDKALSTLEGQKASKSTAPSKQVLEEDEFVEGIERIIERDFFPDLGKLRAQSEYLDALRTNDIETLRAIHLKYNRQKGHLKTPEVYSTPASFETPAGPGTGTPQTKSEVIVGSSLPKDTQKKDEKSKTDGLSLNQYLAKNTSEDNHSFEEILRESEERRKLKNAWLYVKDGEQKALEEKYLTLPSIEEQAALTGNPHTKLDTWKYRPDNALMYIPEAAPLTDNEKVALAAKKQQKIVYNNTRISRDVDVSGPGKKAGSRSKQALAYHAHARAQINAGKIGADGKEIACETPKVNGYGFLSTPTPAPGADGESPFMTWGEIEGTPFDLDRTPVTSRTSGPVFKIPEIPKRDQVGHALADQVHQGIREKKRKALESAKRMTSPMNRSKLSSDRLSYLSPAAQRLASARGVTSPLHTDKALRSSYATPSPGASRTRGTPTPGSSKFNTPSTTPSKDTVTPVRKRKGETTPKIASARPSSSGKESADSSTITDNLLNLPKRSKASDFF